MNLFKLACQVRSSNRDVYWIYRRETRSNLIPQLPDCTNLRTCSTITQDGPNVGALWQHLGTGNWKL